MHEFAWRCGRRISLLVLHDITQLKRLEVMRHFVANVSHELRTPPRF